MKNYNFKTISPNVYLSSKSILKWCEKCYDV